VERYLLEHLDERRPVRLSLRAEEREVPLPAEDEATRRQRQHQQPVEGEQRRHQEKHRDDVEQRPVEALSLLVVVNHALRPSGKRPV